MTAFGPFRPAKSRPGRFSTAPSPVLAYLTPWVSIVVASGICGLPTIASSPFMPPLGFLALLSCRQLQPGLLPVWAGLPLGFADDLVSGQPMGSGIMLFSVAMITLEVIEYRWPWRHFAIEWAVAAVLIVVYIIATAFLAHMAGGVFSLILILPQLLLAVVVYPVVARAMGRADRLRLTRFWVFR